MATNVARSFSGSRLLLKFQRLHFPSEVLSSTRDFTFNQELRLLPDVSPFSRGFVFRRSFVFRLSPGLGSASRNFHKTVSLDNDSKESGKEPEAEADPKDKESEKERETKAGVDPKDKEIAMLKDKHLRCLAELENQREISRREVEMASQFAIQKFAKDILSAVDNLELALASVPPELRTEPTVPTESASITNKLVNLYKGVYLTESELLNTLKRHGIEKIEPKLGEKFDPKIHEALYQASVNGQDVGTIFDIQKIGYSLNGRILRPPQVGVVRAAD